MQLPCSAVLNGGPLGGASSSWTRARGSVNALSRSPSARYFQLGLLALIAAWSVGVIFLLASGETGTDALIPIARWRIAQRVQPGHPLVYAWARQIRALSEKPNEQAALAEQTVWHLVRYWDETDVWGHHCIPRIEEMETQARIKGWDTLRGNCISQSIVLCSLLRALGFPAQIEATSSHAWVQFVADGRNHTALQYEDGPNLTRELPLPSRQPEKLVAAKALGANANGCFEPLLPLPDSLEPAPYFERPAFLLALPLAALFWIWFFREWDRSSPPIRASQRLSIRHVALPLRMGKAFFRAPRKYWQEPSLRTMIASTQNLFMDA